MEKLALNGGAPVRTEPFTRWPFYNEAEENALLRALNSGLWWRNSGHNVKEFESSFALHEGAEKCIAVTNGTHAIELALMTLSIGRNDEVIVPAITFVSTASAIQRVGATPVIVDVELETYNIDISKIESAITGHTKAIIAVHMAGEIANLESLSNLANKHNLALIQDAAHAQGGQWKQKELGRYNSISTYSFQNAKLMTCGEGGAVTFPSEALYHRAFLIHNCGREPTDKSYIHTEIGSNFRLNEFSAAILNCQLGRLKGQSDLRNKNLSYLKEILRNSGITFQHRNELCTYNPVYMVMFRLPSHLKDKRDMFVTALNAEGIPCVRSYRPLYQIESMYKVPSLQVAKRAYAEKCLAAEEVGETAIWMPHNLMLGAKADIEDIAEAILKVKNGIES